MGQAFDAAVCIVSGHNSDYAKGYKDGYDQSNLNKKWSH